MLTNKNPQALMSPSSLSQFFGIQSRKIDYAIFSAMPEELEFFKNIFANQKCENIKVNQFEFKIYEYKKRKIIFAHTGLGTSFAASVVTLVHYHFRPNYIFLSGTAGAIKPELKLCNVVIVEEAFEAEIQEIFKLVKGTPFESCLMHPLKKECFPAVYAADQELLELTSHIDFSGAEIHRGTAVSSNTFPAPQELFDKIKSKNPCSIDMETSAFYQIAWLLNVRALAVRGISNILNHDGTDDKVHESDLHGSSAAAANVLSKIIDSLILAEDMKKEQRARGELVMNKEVSHLIKQLKLQPHPEGGFFSQSFKSTQRVQSLEKNRYDNESRSAGTSIYYLLDKNDFSAWHSLASDEIWHYHKGSSVKIHVIDRNGELVTHVLGDPLENLEAVFQVVIPAGYWFAAENSDKTSYCLVGCTVNPGFEFMDFKLADREALSKQFPQYSLIINKLTRVSREEIIINEVNSGNKISKTLLSRL